MKNNKYTMALDQIIDTVLNNGDSGSKDPEFVQACEKNVTRALFDYTRRTASPDQDNLISEDATTALIDEKSLDLLDEICKSNRIYMKEGMKIGAGIIFQLLGR